MANELDGAFEVIEELLAECEKCGKSAGGARWRLPNESYEEGMALCESCYEDKDGLQKWFAGCLKEALENSDEYEKLPNGNYRFIGAK